MLSHMIKLSAWGWLLEKKSKAPLGAPLILGETTSSFLANYDKIRVARLPGVVMGHGAMAAQQTLDLFILVRIRMPQPGSLFLIR